MALVVGVVVVVVVVVVVAAAYTFLAEWCAALRAVRFLSDLSHQIMVTTSANMLS